MSLFCEAADEWADVCQSHDFKPICFSFHLLFWWTDSVCYFPIEYQGTFLMQEQLFGGISGGSPSASGGSTGGLSSSIGGISYSEITVEADSIPVWGRCYRRRGNIVILKDSTGNQDCMRCIHLTLKTPNVIQIHAEGKEWKNKRLSCINRHSFDKEGNQGLHQRHFGHVMICQETERNYDTKRPTRTSSWDNRWNISWCYSNWW